MDGSRKAKEPFRFYTRLHLTELTGLHASTLGELLALVREVNGSCIYHHTHRFLQQHLYLSPEPPNDFAFWIRNVLGEDELAEKLASINTVQFATIRGLRDKIALTIDEYLKKRPAASKKAAGCGEEFNFIKSVSFVLFDNYEAYDLREFIEALKKIPADSLYFHIFESRLRLEKDSNDFSNWLENSLGEKELAEKIARLDPYTYTTEDLRKVLINMFQRAIV